MPPLVKRWCRNLPGLNQPLLFQSPCECLHIPSELYWHKNAVPDRTFLKLCSHVQSYWKICSIPKSQSFWSSMLYIWHSLLEIRETERDWDKDLAEDVKGECESKYGPVAAIKVEKETQVSLDLDVHLLYLSLTKRRAKFMSNSMLSKMPKWPFKDSMAVGLVDDKYLQPLSLTLSCKLINRMLKTRPEEIPLKITFLTQMLLIDFFFSFVILYLKSA